MYRGGGGRSSRGRSSHQSYQHRGGSSGGRHFSHGQQRDSRGGRGGAGYDHQQQQQPVYKFCKFFTGGQACRNGDRCNFAHVLTRTAALQEGHAPVTSIAFAVPTSSIASTSNDGMLRLWSCVTFQRESVVQLGFNANYVIASQQLLLVCYDDGMHTGGPPIESVAVGHAKAITLADHREFPLMKDAFMQHAHAQSVVSATFMDQAGMQILTGGLEGMIHEWVFNEQLQTFQRVKAYEGHARAVTCLLYIPELNLVWSGSQDTTIRVWSAETAECVAVITASASGHSDAVTCMDRFDVDGVAYIVTGGLDQQINVFEAANGAHLTTAPAGGQITCLRVMTQVSGQAILLIGLVDGRIVIRGLPQLDALLGVLDHQSACHTGPVRSIIACSQLEFATAAEDAVIYLWQLQQPLEVPAAPHPGMGV